MIAEPAGEAGEAIVLTTDVDDPSPEYLDPLREALVAAGALDVQVWSTQMKKGRTGFRVEAVVAAAGADQVAEALFRHSTTAGVRRQVVERVTLARREVEVEAAYGSLVRVKVLEGPDGPPETGIRRCRRGGPADRTARFMSWRASFRPAPSHWWHIPPPGRPPRTRSPDA